MPKISEEDLSPQSKASDISRRPVLDYFNVAGAGDRFWRLFSSREKMIEGVKTLAWVIPLTILIWIYAVREQVVQPNSPNVNNVVIHFTSSDPSLAVEFAGQGDPTVNLQVTGSQQSFEVVREKLTTEIPRGITVDLGSSLGVGDNQPVNIADHIQNLDVFRNNGVTVELSQPTYLNVNVDQKVSKVVSVVAPAIANLSSETRFEPSKVTVTGPRKELDKIISGESKVVARLDGYPQLKQPGSHTISSVPLVTVPELERVKISPDQVTANIVVLADDVTYEIKEPIPVNEVIPATLTGYYVDLSPADYSIAHLVVKGPQQAIDAIANGTFKVQATLVIDSSDVGKEVSQIPHFVLPDGVSVTGEALTKAIKFTVKQQ